MATGNATIGIIGCGGFIGSHLVERLLAAGSYRVLGVDQVSTKLDTCLGHERFEFVQADVYDAGVVSDAVRRSDVVVSLVALCNPSLYNTVPVDVIELNFSHPLELARVCTREQRWLVHFSTSEVYGKTVEGLVGEHAVGEGHEELRVLDEDCTPLVLGPVRAQRWSYACAKQLAERMLVAYGFQKGLEYTIIRPFNFIGPRMDYIPGVDGEGIPRVLACFMEALMRDKPLKLVNGGQARRTFTYIGDAIDAVMAVLRHRPEARNRIFNVGNPANEMSIAELAGLMIRLYEELRPDSAGTHRVEHVTGTEFYGEGYEDSDRRVPVIDAARKLLGWEPHVGLEEALRGTMLAYLDRYESSVTARAAC